MKKLALVMELMAKFAMTRAGNPESVDRVLNAVRRIQDGVFLELDSTFSDEECVLLSEVQRMCGVHPLSPEEIKWMAEAYESGAWEQEISDVLEYGHDRECVRRMRHYEELRTKRDGRGPADFTPPPARSAEAEQRRQVEEMWQEQLRKEAAERRAERQ